MDGECVKGCACKPGEVEQHGHCIDPKNCSCVHNKQYYAAGQHISKKCNTCVCVGGFWQCTNERCNAECSLIGENHFSTFDEKQYVFNGDCEYVLVSNVCNFLSNSTEQTETDRTNFVITYRSQTCFNHDYICSRSVYIQMGNTTITLQGGLDPEIRGFDPDINYSLEEHGFFYILQTSIGLTLLWDHGTRIYIRASTMHFGALCGLCGNYDEIANNDMQLADGGTVTSGITFGNSWKTSDDCVDVNAMYVEESKCTENSHRHQWAIMKCAVLLDVTVFGACHGVVDYHWYHHICINDACGCDQGDDCLCFCTAVAAYAHQCGQHGVPVWWRNPDLCPTMCEYLNYDPILCIWHYNPCGDACPHHCCNPEDDFTEHCDVGCVEGCHPECAPGLIYSHTNHTCVEPEACPTCPVISTAPTFPTTAVAISTTSKIVTATSVKTGTTSTVSTITPRITMYTTACPPCISANGTIYGRNETWIENCLQYECIAIESVSTTCQSPISTPLICPNTTVNCTEYEMRVTTYNEETCCYTTECECNYTMCDIEPECTIYEQINITGYSIDFCCLEYECVCLNDTFLDALCPNDWSEECPLGSYLTNVTANSTCCEKWECMCDQCVVNGTLYEVDEEIIIDECVVMKCSWPPSSECPFAVIIYNGTEDCPDKPDNSVCRTEFEEVIVIPTDGCCSNFSCQCMENLTDICPYPNCSEFSYLEGYEFNLYLKVKTSQLLNVIRRTFYICNMDIQQTVKLLY